ncbi:HNH endonuclease [Fictibacillus halophilus]|uniref:HNH endonuclease n=1 Tax=Fictibacillus halophilus TaxID=1610490 RepID=UPI003636CD7E
MASEKYPKEFLELVQQVSNKRAKFVIEQILKHGQVSTEEIKAAGYNHPPRAAGDVKDLGIPLRTIRVKDSTGRMIGAYVFEDISNLRNNILNGRKNFPKAFKQALLLHYGNKCEVCNTAFEKRYLQIDHRVPFQVGGDSPLEVEHYMLVCSPCNRSKSWSCEHCDNWLRTKNPEICKSCYWGNPKEHEHIALRRVKRADIMFEDDEVGIYAEVKTRADKEGVSVQSYIKKYLENLL